MCSLPDVNGKKMEINKANFTLKKMPVFTKIFQKNKKIVFLLCQSYSKILKFHLIFFFSINNFTY